jgi:predicted DNA-binding transcriptional regulator AlpA
MFPLDLFLTNRIKVNQMNNDTTNNQSLVEAIRMGVGYSSDRTLAKYFDTSRSTIWLWSKTGRLPKPIKLSEGCTRWCNKAIKHFEKEAAS